MPKHLSSRLKWLAAVFALILVLMGASGLFLYESFRQFSDQQARVEHTHEVILELEKAVASLIHSESSVRGYVLTRSDTLLDRYRSSIAAAQTHLKLVQNLVADNSGQQNLIRALSDRVEERIRIFDATITAFHNQGRTAAAEQIDGGVRVMSDVLRIAEEMEQRERALLVARTKELEGRRTFTNMALLLVTTFNLALGGILYSTVRRGMKIQARDSQTKEREKWLAEIQAAASLSVSGDLSVQETCREIMKFFAEKLGISLANLYIEQDGKLVLEAGVSYHDGKRDEQDFFRVSEGLLGIAATRREPTVIQDVPRDYFMRIESSLGSSSPHLLCVAPLYFRSTLVGVMEFASFKGSVNTILDEIERVMNALATGLEASRSRQKLQELLEETQRQAEELQMQQEELRTTNEELNEQTKALLESQEQLQVQTEELRQTNEELEQQTKMLETQQEAVEQKNEALEASRRRIEEKANELERVNAYKSEFLAKMSHELRTPLNSIMILATLLKENKEGNLGEQQIDFSKTIYEAGGDLLTLINDILDLSKLEAKKLFARPEPFGIRQFIAQMSSVFVVQAEQKGLKLLSSVSDDVVDRFVTDRQRLQQILRNLLSNAMKFTEHGEIRLSVETSRNTAGFVRISVVDTGIGIPESKKRLIWEAFEQADGSVSRKYGGTGLGLTISRELASLLGGQISVESEAGMGSEFTIEIPRELAVSGTQAETKIRPAATPEAAAFSTGDSKVKPVHMAPLRSESYGSSSGSSKSLLIVEQDPKFAQVIIDVARGHGFEPLAVADRSSAMRILQEKALSAVLLDLGLANNEGLELLEQMRNDPRLRNIPVHAIAKGHEPHEAMRLGAIGYLAKSVTPDGLRAALDRIENLIDGRLKRILVVEDDAVQNKAIQSLVSASDTHVLSVSTGREALEVLKKPGADCVILDLSLPDISGFELLEELNSNTEISLPPVIVYTGAELSAEEEDRLRLFSDSIIIKGGRSPERLLDEVNLFLRRVDAGPQMTQRREFRREGVESEQNFSGCRLLVVDDDLRNLFALTSALEGKGFRVTVARNGIEALEKLEERGSFDAVLTDIMMPKMDGFETMRRIRSVHRFKSIPIIALTAKTMKGEQEKCIEAGANDYLPKPINLSDLLSVLKVWLPRERLLSP